LRRWRPHATLRIRTPIPSPPALTGDAPTSAGPPGRAAGIAVSILIAAFITSLASASAAERAVAAPAAKADLAFPDETLDQWHGHVRHRFRFHDRDAWVVEPAAPLPGNPWSWCMMFPDAFAARCAAPQLVAAGFHHAFLDVGNTFGSPAAVARLDAFHDELVRRGLAPRSALIGLSRGGLYAHRYATEHPEKVAVIYGDGAVCDFKSWPGGKGTSKGSVKDWAACLEAYGFADVTAALAYRGNPVDTLPTLAAAGIALVHVVGDADDVVPPADNGEIVADRYRTLGGTVELIRKPGCGHHPHGLDDPQQVVDFILRYATPKKLSLPPAGKDEPQHEEPRPNKTKADETTTSRDDAQQREPSPPDGR
jgi:pimeloyl-ACP methyl ester carboxylesterase